MLFAPVFGAEFVQQQAVQPVVKFVRKQRCQAGSEKELGPSAEFALQPVQSVSQVQPEPGAELA